MKQIIHINQHVIKENNKKLREGDVDLKPCITVKTYKDNQYLWCAELVSKSTGQQIGKVVYSPHAPLSCGAKAWVEIDTDIVEVKELEE
jgi:hypothetical protein